MEMYGNDQKIIIGLCGLPARGKTYIARKLTRYLNWVGYKAKAFNIGNYRRLICGTSNCTADFFDPGNEDAVKARNECALLALNDLESFLTNGGDIAIYDGTNTTKNRRKLIQHHVKTKMPEIYMMWIESICTDDKIIEENIKLTKLSSPDYIDVTPDKATQDFKTRIEKYSLVYEPITVQNDGPDISFVKVINVGKQVIINNIHGYLQSKIVSYLMNLHNTPRPIYFARHGESLYNIHNKIGGDSDLSAKGEYFAYALSDFLKNEQEHGSLKGFKEIKIFTSTLKRSVNTANKIMIKSQLTSSKMLDELNVGICDGMSYQEIKQKFPQIANERNNDKLTYRYPRGESYLDLIQRIEPIIFEIERSREPVIVIGHQANLRCLYAYFAKHEILEVPYIDIPLHTVIKLIPETYFCHEIRHSLDTSNNNNNWTEKIIHNIPLIDDYAEHQDFENSQPVLMSPFIRQDSLPYCLVESEQKC